MRGQTEYIVTIEKKMNAPWMDDVIRRTRNTKRAFPPWNIIMMERKYTKGFRWGIENKDYIFTDILSPIRGLETKQPNQDIFGT